ncbi:MAG: sulfotransferase family protein [Woeseiaceae bacterium]
MPIDFLVVGAQKAGTTSFRHYLGRHPQIGLHTVSEPHFFDNESIFVPGPPDLRAYHKGFPSPRDDFRRGEVTPIYMYWEPAIRRIRDYNPLIRMIAILRNPIERAYSHWAMEKYRFNESLSFYDALLAEPTRPKSHSPERRVHFYVERGRYCEQIRRIWQYFDKSQLLILRSEELNENPGPVLRKVYEFLEISDDGYQQIKPVHLRKGKYAKRMDERSAEYLRSVFEKEILELEKLLGWDLTAWLK